MVNGRCDQGGPERFFYQKGENAVVTSFRGFIDLHTHGIGRYDTRTERPEQILQIAALHASEGTGAILPTIYPGPVEEMRNSLMAVRNAIEMQKGANPSTAIQQRAAVILGAHLEGPFLNPERCGSLDKKIFLKPSLSSLKKVIAGYEDIIKIITIAPEIPGALKVIEKCSELGIKVNMGHSDATYKQAVEGKKAGATGITHLFNAMRPFHHREPGLAGLGLIDEDLYVEVIADGIHLHPKTLELIFSRKRLDRIILVSDSVKAGKTRKGAVYDKDGVLAGSATTIEDVVRRLRTVGIPDAEIIEASTDNPARYIELR
jgi:N-acetylglucosamine-6-phosphate deacetylase